MDFFGNLTLGFSVALSWNGLLYCLLGVTLGTFVGALPGVGALAAITMLLPVTFHLEPTLALIMLAGIYYGAQYGGSTASILLNLPGTPSNAVTCIDGYAMAKQGRAGAALVSTTLASFLGACVGIVVMMLFAPALAQVALRLSAPEYFSIMVMALLAAAGLTRGSMLKGVTMVVVGLLLSMIGTDMNTGARRYTFGVPELADGLQVVVIAMGLFGIAEVISTLGLKHLRPEAASHVPWRDLIPRGEDLRRGFMAAVRGTGIGAVFGILPATGPTVSSFVSYAVEKRVAADPSRFGRGAIEGVAGPEAANNAAAQTAFIPTLTLGIPGDVTMALMLGALMIQGIAPGPQVVSRHPELFWGLIASFWIGNVMLVVLNLPLVHIWVKLLSIPYRLLFPAIMLFVSIGVFSVHNSPFDVALAAAFGLGGYALIKLGYEAAPLLLGFVLGPMLEENFRRALLIARGDLTVFITRPVSAAFLAITVLILAFALVAQMRGRAERSAGRRQESEPAGDTSE